MGRKVLVSIFQGNWNTYDLLTVCTIWHIGMERSKGRREEGEGEGEMDGCD